MAPLGRNQTIWYDFQVPAAAEFVPIIKAFLRVWKVLHRFKNLENIIQIFVTFCSVGIFLKGRPFGRESSADSYECDFLHSVWGGSGIQNRTDLEDGSRTDGRQFGWLVGQNATDDARHSLNGSWA